MGGCCLAVDVVFLVALSRSAIQMFWIRDCCNCVVDLQLIANSNLIATSRVSSLEWLLCNRCEPKPFQSRIKIINVNNSKKANEPTNSGTNSIVIYKRIE